MVDIELEALQKLPTTVFRDILASTDEAILITDTELDSPGPKIVYANPAFTRLTGWTLAEIIGKTPRILQGEKTNKKELENMKKQLRETGSYKYGNVVNYKKDGTIYVLELTIVPIRDHNGDAIHYMAFQRDVTVLSTALEEIRAHTEKINVLIQKYGIKA